MSIENSTDTPYDEKRITREIVRTEAHIVSHSLRDSKWKAFPEIPLTKLNQQYVLLKKRLPPASTQAERLLHQFINARIYKTHSQVHRTGINLLVSSKVIAGALNILLGRNAYFKQLNAQIELGKTAAYVDHQVKRLETQFFISKFHPDIDYSIREIIRSRPKEFTVLTKELHFPDITFDLHCKLDKFGNYTFASFRTSGTENRPNAALISFNLPVNEKYAIDAHKAVNLFERRSVYLHSKGKWMYYDPNNPDPAFPFSFKELDIVDLVRSQPYSSLNNHDHFADVLTELRAGNKCLVERTDRRDSKKMQDTIFVDAQKEGVICISKGVTTICKWGSPQPVITKAQEIFEHSVNYDILPRLKK